VVLKMRILAGLWRWLFPAEQCRLAQLLIERVVIADGGLEIIWRDQGRQELAGDCRPAPSARNCGNGRSMRAEYETQDLILARADHSRTT
jgi:hypothetical protein